MAAVGVINEREHLFEAKHRAELAEVRAEERQRSIDFLDRQVLMLAPVEPATDDGPVVLNEPVSTAPPPKKRRWHS